MSIKVIFFAFISIFLTSCRTTAHKTAQMKHIIYDSGFNRESCLIAKARAANIRVCFSGAANEESRRQSLAALNVWHQTVSEKFVEAKAVVIESCNNPDVLVNVWDGYATPVSYLNVPPRIQVYTQTEIGRIVHEFGHVYACLSDVRQERIKEKCPSTSVMCHGSKLVELSEIDKERLYSQYRKLVLQSEEPAKAQSELELIPAFF